MNNKTVVFAVHSLCPGGQERVMSILINEFSKYKGVDIQLIMFGDSPEIFYKIPDTIKVHMPDFKFNNQKRILSTIKSILFVRKRLRLINPDAVLSFGEYWNNFILLACVGLKIPVFVSDRNQPNKQLNRFHEVLRKLLYPGAKGIIAQTAIARDILFTKTKHKNITIIGNPITQFSGEDRVKDNIVLSVGRLIDTKHHDELIRLFSRINNKNWKLIIVGDDAIKQKNKSKLERLIRELNMIDYIELAGNRKDVETFYSMSKIFAFTSSSEGFPNVIGEAMSAALPVVAFDCIAGPSEMIENDMNGFLIPLFNYTQFEEKLSSLMINDEMRQKMGESAKQSITAFDASHIAEKFYRFMLTPSK